MADVPVLYRTFKQQIDSTAVYTLPTLPFEV